MAKIKYKLKKPGVIDDNAALDKIKAQLNPKQWDAVKHGRGPQLIIAGAGTGKTRTLIYRVAYLIEKGVKASSILLLTFTRKASREMTRRAAAISDARCHQVNSGTFHSFANQILRRFATQLGYNENFSIADSSDSEDIINLLRNQKGFNDKKRRFAQKATLQKIFSRHANTGLEIAEIVTDEYEQYLDDLAEIEALYVEFQAYKKKQSIMDYDDLMLNLCELLKKHEAVRIQVRKEYEFIIIDEYQDTNLVQSEIALLLAGDNGNITVVGDDCQSIYSFRGANHKNILKFPETFPQAKTYTLDTNYRSTQKILNLCNNVMENAEDKFDKNLNSNSYNELLENLKTQNIGITADDLNKNSEHQDFQDSQANPVRVDFNTIHEQAEFTAQHILALREEGVPLSKIAVLFRSAYHSNELEIILGRYNIPFIKQGGIRFIEAAHVKDLVSILKICFNPDDVISWQRVLLLLEGVGSVTAQNILAKMGEQIDNKEVLLDASFSKKRFGTALKRLHFLLTELDDLSEDIPLALEKAIEYYTPILEKKHDDFKRRTKDLEALQSIGEQYTALESFLTEISLDPPEKSPDKPEDSDVEDENLVLSTVHSAKGLEYHSVFVLSLSEGFFPAGYALKSSESLEEERRLFYVAVTRAEKNLFLLTNRAWDRSNDFFLDAAEPSRFLEELNPDLMEEWEIEEEDAEL